MALFAVITLVIILLSLTHLLNWAMRGLWTELSEELPSKVFLTIITIFFYFLIVLGIIRWIIIWGALIK